MMLAITQGLLTAFLAWLAFRVTIRPINEGEKIKLVLLEIVVVIVSLALVVLGGIQAQQQNKDLEGSNGTIAALTNEVGKVTMQLNAMREDDQNQRNIIGQGFSDISNEFSTNSTIDPYIRLSVLATQMQHLTNEGDVLQKKHDLIIASPTDIVSLREMRTNELDLQDNLKRQAAVQQEMDNLRTQMNQQDQDSAEKINMDEVERWLHGLALPVFDHAISEMSRTCQGLSLQNGEPCAMDFIGETPTIYASNLERDGIILAGTNSISIGTNSAWNFQIYTTVNPRNDTFVRRFLSTGNLGARSFATLTIEAQTTNSDSILTITPRMSYPRYTYTNISDRLNAYTNISIYRIEVALNVSNGLDMNDLASPQDYIKTVDKAILRLIQSQDQVSPLPDKTH